MTAAETAERYTIRPLSVQTWEAYAALAEKHNGVWGGCFCTWFHPRRKDEGLADVVEAGRPYRGLLGGGGGGHPPRGSHAGGGGDGPSRSSWCGRAGRTPPWSSTARRRWPGASTARRRSCRTSTTAGNT